MVLIQTVRSDMEDTPLFSEIPATQPTIPMKPKTPAILSLMFAVPALASAAVDFVKDVQPILEYNCVRCHNPKATDFEKGDTDRGSRHEGDGDPREVTIVAGDARRAKLYTTTTLPDDAKKADAAEGTRSTRARASV